MSARGYLFVVFSWVVLIALHTVMQGVNDQTPDLLVVLSLRVLTFKEFMGISLPWPNIDFVESAWNLATWNFAFFRGNLQWVRWFVGLPLMGYLSYGFYRDIMPTVIAGASALVNFLVNILGALNPLRYFTGSSG